VIGPVNISVHVQQGGHPVASVTLPDGRVLRACGRAPKERDVKYWGRSHTDDVLRKEVILVMKNWITWERRSRPHYDGKK
jgi:hypothetical protein